MLKYNCGNLSAPTLAVLASKQATVDLKPTHEERYQRATALFNNKTGPAWDEIRGQLAKIAPSGTSCYYCERDRFRDIEHVRPKRHYPDKAFVWENYVYACVVCNQDKKRDTYAVIVGGALISFDRTLPFTAPVPVGVHALLDIRSEDPLDFFTLDFRTGRLIPSVSGLLRIRAEFTRDLFDLNSDDLTSQRRAALRSYADYINQYKKARNAKNGKKMRRIWSEIKKLSHPTVLVEMRRQAANFPKLARLFEDVPGFIGHRPV
jgi:uncharacterized protein (TIGR02646 family)